MAVSQHGVLRYCGRTLFASGLWAGIELDEAAGKNNGSIDGIPYFQCPPNYGMMRLWTLQCRLKNYCEPKSSDITVY